MSDIVVLTKDELANALEGSFVAGAKIIACQLPLLRESSVECSRTIADKIIEKKENGEAFLGIPQSAYDSVEECLEIFHSSGEDNSLPSHASLANIIATYLAFGTKIAKDHPEAVPYDLLIDLASTFSSQIKEIGGLPFLTEMNYNSILELES